MKPEYLDKWFPIDKQRQYVSTLVKQNKLTRRRAECFVRLWAYLLLKQQHELGKRVVQPLSQLDLPQGAVSCTHREAAELFYANKDRGSDRAAGMMLDQLVAIGLLEKEFDGQTTCIQILPWQELTNPCQSKEGESISLKTDDFNPKTDAVLVANSIANHYKQNFKAPANPHRITRILRTWATQYPTGMRVLRRCDNQNPVGIYILFPTTRESEENLFASPDKTRYLTADTDSDPFQAAIPGDLDCTCICMRTWIIDLPCVTYESVCLLTEDMQKTLIKMQADFPNLCDLYGIAISPAYEQLRIAVGFQKTGQDSQGPVQRIYIPVERFLALDVRQAFANISFLSAAKV